jgi:hypothetical protein
VRHVRGASRKTPARYGSVVTLPPVVGCPGRDPSTSAGDEPTGADLAGDRIVENLYQRQYGRRRRLKKCHEPETDLGDIAVRQPRTRRSAKINGPFVGLAVGAYIMARGTMGGPFDGASMNPARSLGPDVAIGNLSTWWVYLIGPVAGAVIAVGVAYVLRGPAKAGEASAAEGTPLNRPT